MKIGALVWNVWRQADGPCWCLLDSVFYNALHWVYAVILMYWFYLCLFVVFKDSVAVLWIMFKFMDVKFIILLSNVKMKLFVIRFSLLVVNCFIQRWGRFRHCGAAITTDIFECWTDTWLYARTWWREVFSTKRESIFLYENSSWSWKIHGIWFFPSKLKAWCTLFVYSA